MRASDRSRTRSRRIAAGLLVLAALAGLGGYVAWRVATRESSTPLTVRQALARFRALPPAARELPAALRGRAPEPGIYVYRTRGQETTHAFGTRRHRYPSRTTIAVSASGCGIRMRWDALETRWDALHACPRAGGGWRLLATSEEHEFFGHRDRRTYRCTPGSVERPVATAPGTRWADRCGIEGTATAEEDLVLGRRTLTVGGARVATLLIRTTSHVTGETRGTGTTLTWILPRTGLVVRRLVANASTTDTLAGDVAYAERYELALTSPRPLR
jgi:hypothetical protein